MSSLDKEAMKHIEGLSKTGAPVEGVDYNAVYVPEHMTIMSLEEHQKFKNRFTGGFSTDSLDSFAKYVADQNEAVCFIHSRRPVAMAIFDLGSIEEPLHAKHKAGLAVDHTAAYQALRQFAQGRQDQEAFAVFMEDWMFNITVEDADGNEMDVRAAIRAVRSVTIDAAAKYESEIQQLGTTKSAMESIEANSKGTPLPAWLTFTCKPLKCISNVDFKIRVGMSLKREEINFILKISGLEQIEEDIASEFSETVKSKLGSNVKAYMGEFDINGRLSL